MRAPDWLTARPVAHRGLHDRARGIIENMPGAASAAISGNFAIECDIQLTADGEAMVHHDDALGRLTEGSGALLEKSAAELRAVKFKDSSERMMSLGDLCGLVNGRVPLVIE
ncbi:MAG: glycerophosphodiester phosphodiesterase family protein, partial [Bradyrhizobium sp.]